MVADFILEPIGCILVLLSTLEPLGTFLDPLGNLKVLGSTFAFGEGFDLL